jgi:uncharacterized protein DUF3530
VKILLVPVAVLMTVFSVAVYPQEPPQPTPEKPAAASERPMVSTGLGAQAIARNHPDASVWLSSEGQEPTLALFQPEQDLPARGALVILADEGMSAASGVADALRAPLSRAGWAVMTLGLPAPPFAVQQWLRQQHNTGPAAGTEPAGEPAEAQGEETDQQQAPEEKSSVMINVMESLPPDKALEQYRETVMASLNAAVDALQEREYKRIVLVGVGRAAGHVTRQVRTDGRASDLVWIAPRFYTDESAGLTELLASARSPSILELYSTFPGDQTLDRVAREREAVMARAGISGYERQPVAMARQPQAREARKLSNRISAWLKR